MKAVVVWATGPGLFVVAPLIAWAVAKASARWVCWVVDEQWQAKIDEWDEQVDTLRALHTTPGGLGDQRGAS